MGAKLATQKDAQDTLLSEKIYQVPKQNACRVLFLFKGSSLL